MILKSVFFTLLFLLFFSCSSKKQEVKPANFFSESKMIEVLVDVRLVESTIRQMAGYGENTEAMANYYYDKILTKHNISSDDFKNNMNYYSQNPEQLYQINLKVVNRLTEIHSEVSSHK